ncbi:hypothetical protein G5I_11753 [Acromyrmex echinatior]|uniref:Uncharacterized protein n=1 Tax=Acromyrmex echinatior TaxID=103372 RepID=F4X0H4_ACREC|nr:hypothetical protein G5I_11753 [Acromyrmex echinatior]
MTGVKSPVLLIGRMGVRVDILPALCHRRDVGGGRVRDGSRLLELCGRMGGARFDFHGISGERGIVAKESDGERRRGTKAAEGEGRWERTGHTGNLPGELHHSGYHGTPETLAVPNCSLIPTGRYIVWVSASASGAYRIRRSEEMFGGLFPLDIKPWQVPLCRGGQEYKRTVPISASINPFSLIRISPLIAVSHTGSLLPP